MGKFAAAGKVVWNGIKKLGGWVRDNPDTAIRTAKELKPRKKETTDTVISTPADGLGKKIDTEVSNLRNYVDSELANRDKKLETQINEVRQSMDQAVTKLDQKIELELCALRKQLHTLKILLGILGGVVLAAVIAIALLAVL